MQFFRKKCLTNKAERCYDKDTAGDNKPAESTLTTEQFLPVFSSEAGIKPTKEKLVGTGNKKIKKIKKRGLTSWLNGATIKAR